LQWHPLLLFYISSLLYGIGVGFSMHGAPAYIAEMSPPSVRGLLVSLKEAMIVLGILMGYVVGMLSAHNCGIHMYCCIHFTGYICDAHDGGWRYTYGSSIPLAWVMLVGTFVCAGISPVTARRSVRIARFMPLACADRSANGSAAVIGVCAVSSVTSPSTRIRSYVLPEFIHIGIPCARTTGAPSALEEINQQIQREEAKRATALEVRVRAPLVNVWLGVMHKRNRQNPPCGTENTRLR
jgi:MFS family permease